MRIVRRPKYITIVLSKNCASNVLDEDHLAIINLLQSEPAHTLVNGLFVTSISSSWIDLITLLKKNIDCSGYGFQLINFITQVEEQIFFNSISGKNQIFSVGVAAALNSFVSCAYIRFKITYIKEFVLVTQKLVYARYKTLSHMNRAEIKTGELGKFSGNLLGIVKLTSEDQRYLIILSFPIITFNAFVIRQSGGLSMVPTQEIQVQFEQFLNSIWSGVLSLVEKIADQKLITSTLKVFFNDQISTNEFNNLNYTLSEVNKVFTIPFETELGQFFIEAWMPKGGKLFF